jgi:hypothetical protein
MASAKKRIGFELWLPDGTRHRALALPGATVDELIGEVLAEFSADIRYLDQYERQRYSLWLPGDDRALPPDRSIQQLGPLTTLEFRERPATIPAGAEPLTPPIYLRYRSHVFRVAWQPGVIGRPEPGLQRNAFLAVNLEPYSLAVSRRQAEVISQGGRLAVRRLIDNPTRLNGELLPFNEEQPEESPAVPLHAGDVLLLERSKIELQCLLPVIQADTHQRSQRDEA